MNESILDESVSGGNSELTERTKYFLTQISKWAKFFAVLGFIGIGFMALLSLFLITMGGSIPNMNQAAGPAGVMGGMPKMLGAIYLVMAALYIMPIIYLNNFATNMKKALASDSAGMYESAFENLKKHFAFIGIFTIVIISIYILIFIIGFSAAAFR